MKTTSNSPQRPRAALAIPAFFLLFLVCCADALPPAEAGGPVPAGADAGLARAKRPAVRVRVDPALAEVAPGDSLVFAATVTGSSNAAVTWRVAEAPGGTIDATGRYTAPATPGTFHVVATSVADRRRTASAQVVVAAPPTVQVDVEVQPAAQRLAPGGRASFVARVTGAAHTAVTWAVVEPGGGAIDGAGTYTAPAAPGTFHVVATSTADPTASAVATAEVADPGAAPDLLPPDRRDTWNPGIPGGIPRVRQVHVTLSSLPANGTGDAGPAINQALLDAHAAYLATGVVQEVVLPAGTFRTASTIVLGRSGVVLRGQGPRRTRLRYDGTGLAVRIGRNQWGTYTAAGGPWRLAADAVKGSRRIALSSADAAGIESGDILCIDEEDDPSFVSMGDARYEKRQPTGDTNGPALRVAGAWRSVTSLIRVTAKTVGATGTVLELADPLHMNFRASRYAQVFQVASEYRPARPHLEGVHLAGVEHLYVTGGPVRTNNVAFCWLDDLEVDGNPGTPNVGSYANPGGISGRSVDLFHAYRCEIRGSYIHHARTIAQGGGAYLLSIGSYTSESLIEDNVVVWGNKPVVGNMMGGGNVIAYNYVDNARTDHESWQESAIDLNHQSFTHSALVEGNWATNLVADTVHGNSGWHVFFRNHATGQNAAPLYGPYPYSSSPDGRFLRAAGGDGGTRELTYVGNVLHAGVGDGSPPVYQVTCGATWAEWTGPTVWRVGDNGDFTFDDGTALARLYRHGNWDSVTGGVVWDPGNPVRALPASLYLAAKPAFFGAHPWPWVEPLATTASGRVGVLPAKARFDALP